MKPSLLILVFSDISRDPRVLKQIHRLKGEYEITSAGFGEQPVENVPHIRLEPYPKIQNLLRFRGVYGLALLLRRYRYLSQNMPRIADAYSKLCGNSWDIILANDVSTIPLASALNPRLGMLADLHEYAPRQNEHSFLWKLLIAPYFRWILRSFAPEMTEVTTVSQGIADEYHKQFGFTPLLVVNATPFHDFEPQPVQNPIRLVHSGIAAPARKLEAMVEGVVNSNAMVELHLYLMPTDRAYLGKLQELAGEDSRVVFHDPVPYQDLLQRLHTYDLGVSTIAPTTFNLQWCLPNKFFDFVQARLGLIVGPSPEMVRYIERFKLGAVTKDFSAESFTDLVQSLTPELVDAWKQASHSVAYDLSAEQQGENWAIALSRITKRVPKL